MLFKADYCIKLILYWIIIHNESEKVKLSITYSLLMNILYEDNHLIIVNKANSEIVQGDKTGDPTLIDAVKEYVKKKYKKPGEVYIGLVHRLDRPTSGIVVLTRTSKALARMNELFKQKEVDKTYWAVVDKIPEKENDTLTHHLVRNEKQNKSYASDLPKKNTKEAKLKYQLRGKGDRYFLLEIKLLTGRHHQIRAQLAQIGCHIKGDLKYGAARSNKGGGIHLHARSIEFIHPVQKTRIRVVAPPPKDNLWDSFVAKIS